jgi:hypothetical protein
MVSPELTMSLDPHVPLWPPCPPKAQKREEAVQGNGVSSPPVPRPFRTGPGAFIPR